jgi:hypothetical protein
MKQVCFPRHIIGDIRVVRRPVDEDTSGVLKEVEKIWRGLSK